jgi:hypothetical protein
MTSPFITTAAKLGIDTANPVGTGIAPYRYDFIDFDLGIEVELKDMNGTRGKYTKDSARVRKNLTRITPRLRCQPTSVELSGLLPWILSGTGYALGNTPAQRYVAFDLNPAASGNLWTLTGVVVDEARFSADQGEPLSLDLGLVGMSYTSPTGQFPGGLALDVSTQPFLFVDCAIQINATTGILSRSFELTVRNGIDRDRFFNSPTLTATNRLTRQITMAVNVPFGIYPSLFTVGEDTAATALVTFTNGSAVLTFTVNGVRFRPKSPTSPFQQEAMLSLEGEIYSPDGSTEGLVVSLATGP